VPPQAALYTAKNLFVFVAFVFALLICDTAACLTSGLARGLAFAATAVFSAFAKIFGIKSLNTFH